MLVKSKEIITEVVMQIEKNYLIRTALNVTVKYSVEDVQWEKLWLDILHKIKENGGSCLIFSFSLSVQEMMFSLFSALTGISVEKLLLGMLTPNDWHRLTDIAGYLYEAPFWFSKEFREIEFDRNDFDLVIEISPFLITKKLVLDCDASISSFVMTKKQFGDYNAAKEWYVYR